MLKTLNRILWIVNVGLIFIILLTVTFGCTPLARSAVDAELCRTAADERLRQRALKTCATDSLEECPEYDNLMAAYHREVEACR